MKLTYTEQRFMNLIWREEPLSSRKLTELCATEFGWKKSTTYTFLKRLEEKGILINTASQVTSLISQGDYRNEASNEIVRETFAGSLPGFLVAFLNDKKLNQEEYAELLKLIEDHREKE